jgi:hypothetical protein
MSITRIMNHLNLLDLELPTEEIIEVNNGIIEQVILEVVKL